MLRSGLFTVFMLAIALLSFGCQGVSSFDLAPAYDINGGLGEYGYDVAFDFAVKPAAEGSMVVALYSDGVTRAAGYGFVTRHPDDYWFVQFDFVVDLGAGKYDKANYHAFVFTPYRPEPVVRNFIGATEYDGAVLVTNMDWDDTATTFAFSWPKTYHDLGAAGTLVVVTYHDGTDDIVSYGVIQDGAGSPDYPDHYQWLDVTFPVSIDGAGLEDSRPYTFLAIE